jgi:ribonuclease PH
MNVVMNSAGQFVEVQGPAEGHAFSHDELKAMLELADNGIRQLFDHQKAVLGG